MQLNIQFSSLQIFTHSPSPLTRSRTTHPSKGSIPGRKIICLTPLTRRLPGRLAPRDTIIGRKEESQGRRRGEGQRRRKFAQLVPARSSIRSPATASQPGPSISRLASDPAPFLARPMRDDDNRRVSPGLARFYSQAAASSSPLPPCGAGASVPVYRTRPLSPPRTSPRPIVPSPRSIAEN